jgi:hypothetical protein
MQEGHMAMNIRAVWRSLKYKVDDVSALEASSNRSVRIVEDNVTASLHQQHTP